MTFGISYVTTKMREAADGAAKIVANFDPEGATEADIQEGHKKVDELAAIAAGAMTKAEADQRIADAAKAEYNKYKTAAMATNALVEAGDVSKQGVLEKLISIAEKLKPQVEDAQHTATDSQTWYEETKGYHEQAVQKWTGMRTALDNARRDLERSKQQEQQETRMASERERAAGLIGRGTGNVALDAMQAAAADAKQHAAAAHLTNMALGHASGVDDDVAAALASVDKGGAPTPSAASRLANL